MIFLYGSNFPKTSKVPGAVVPQADNPPVAAPAAPTPTAPTCAEATLENQNDLRLLGQMLQMLYSVGDAVTEITPRTMATSIDSNNRRRTVAADYTAAENYCVAHRRNSTVRVTQTGVYIQMILNELGRMNPRVAGSLRARITTIQIKTSQLASGTPPTGTSKEQLAQQIVELTNGVIADLVNVDLSAVPAPSRAANQLSLSLIRRYLHVVRFNAQLSIHSMAVMGQMSPPTSSRFNQVQREMHTTDYSARHRVPVSFIELAATTAVIGELTSRLPACRNEFPDFRDVPMTGRQYNLAQFVIDFAARPRWVRNFQTVEPNTAALTFTDGHPQRITINGLFNNFTSNTEVSVEGGALNVSIVRPAGGAINPHQMIVELTPAAGRATIPSQIRLTINHPGIWLDGHHSVASESGTFQSANIEFSDSSQPIVRDIAVRVVTTPVAAPLPTPPVRVAETPADPASATWAGRNNLRFRGVLSGGATAMGASLDQLGRPDSEFHAGAAVSAEGGRDLGGGYVINLGASVEGQFQQGISPLHNLDNPSVNDNPQFNRIEGSVYAAADPSASVPVGGSVRLRVRALGNDRAALRPWASPQGEDLTVSGRATVRLGENVSIEAPYRARVGWYNQPVAFETASAFRQAGQNFVRASAGLGIRVSSANVTALGGATAEWENYPNALDDNGAGVVGAGAYAGFGYDSPSRSFAIRFMGSYRNIAQWANEYSASLYLQGRVNDNHTAIFGGIDAGQENLYLATNPHVGATVGITQRILGDNNNSFGFTAAINGGYQAVEYSGDSNPGVTSLSGWYGGVTAALHYDFDRGDMGFRTNQRSRNAEMGRTMDREEIGGAAYADPLVGGRVSGGAIPADLRASSAPAPATTPAPAATPALTPMPIPRGTPAPQNAEETDPETDE